MSASSCPVHFPPAPRSCLHCASYLLIGVFKDDPFENNSFEEGTSDLATSIYPEIEESMHIVASPSIAQFAKMNPSPKWKNKPRPGFVIAVGPESSFHSIMRREERDFYPERLALSPQDWPTLFAEPHYVDHLALSPTDAVSSVVSPKSKLPATTRRLGRETRRVNREVEVIVIPDDDDNEDLKETRMERKKIATRASTNGVSSILPPGDISQREPSRKRKRGSDEKADTAIDAIEDPIRTQRVQVMKAPRTKALTLGPVPKLAELPRIQRGRKRKHRSNDDSTPTSSSSGEEIIHAKTCKCRDCKGKQEEENSKPTNQRMSRKRRKTIHEAEN